MLTVEGVVLSNNMRGMIPTETKDETMNIEERSNKFSASLEDLTKKGCLYMVYHRKNTRDVNLYYGTTRKDINTGSHFEDLRNFEWVAQTEGVTLNQVFVKTQHGAEKSCWQDNDNVEAYAARARSTMVGDIIVGNDKAYIVDTDGYSVIETN